MNDELRFNTRRIVECRIPITKEMQESGGKLYREASKELAKWMLANNCIGFNSDRDIMSRDVILQFWMTTYNKPIDWSRL